MSPHGHGFLLYYPHRIVECHNAVADVRNILIHVATFHNISVCITAPSSIESIEWRVDNFGVDGAGGSGMFGQG